MDFRLQLVSLQMRQKQKPFLSLSILCQYSDLAEWRQSNSLDRYSGSRSFAALYIATELANLG